MLIEMDEDDYDRIAHFSVGFYAYPIAEFFAAKRLVAARVLVLSLPVLVILAVAGA